MASRSIISAALLLVLGLAREAAASCATTTSVTTTIQAAVNAIPSPLTGDYCITVPQNAYGEQVLITGKDTAGFRIYITSAADTDPIIDPPGGSTAAFVVDNASVTLIGLRLSATNNPSYSVLASSGVLDLHSIAASAPVAVTTQTLINDVTGPALIADGAAVRIQASSASVVTASGSGLNVSGLWATTFTAAGAGAGVFNTTGTFISIAGNTPSVAGIVATTISVTGGFGAVTGVTASSITVDGVSVVVTSVTAPYLTVSGTGLDLLSSRASTATIAGSGAQITSVEVDRRADVLGANVVLFDVRGASWSVFGSGALVSNTTLYGPLSVSSGAGSVVRDGSFGSVTLGPNADQGLVTRVTAGLVTFDQSQQPVLAYSQVFGSTGVIVSGSTGAAVHSNVLVLSSAVGNGVYAAANVDLVIASNTILGGEAGVHLGRGNQGTLVVSSNVISGGLFGLVGSQQATSQVHISSNVIGAHPRFGANSWGLRLDGLSAGASVYNNTVYHASATTMGGGTFVFIHSRFSNTLIIHHNRLASANMTSVGNLHGIHLEGTPNSQVFNNDGWLQSSSLTNSFMLQLSAGSTNARVRNNVFVMGVVGTSTATINVDAISFSGFLSDYNDFHSLSGSPSLLISGIRRRFPLVWRNVSGLDFNSFAADPDWVTVVSTGDFHPRSQGGRWDPALASFVGDPVTSPTIGRGPAGGNLGSYGGTAEASLPFTDLPAGCADGFNVKVDGSRDMSDLQLAVDSLPRSAAVDSCVVVRDTETYSGLSMDGLFQAPDVRLTVMADPSFVSSAPVVTSLAIRVSSVTVDRLIVRPTASLPVAVIASSFNVVLTTITVDANAFATTAGIRVSSMGAVRYSSVAVHNAIGLDVTGLGVEVSSSWLKTSAPFSALRLGSGSLRSNGPLTLLGVLDLSTGLWQAGPHDHQLGGNISLSNTASISHQGSTLTLTGAADPHHRMFLAPSAGAVLGHVVVKAASATFNRGFDALNLRFESPAATGTFAAGQTFTIGEFVVHGSSLPRTVLRSSADGSQWLLNVGRSSVTASWVRDSRALGFVHANDGTTLDGANNVNWNFKPFVATLVPGETWVNGTGKSGGATPVAAGDLVPITAQAYDSSSNTVAYPAFGVALTWTEVFVATPAAQPLEAGATVFSNVVFRTAQTNVLSPRTTDAWEVWGTTLTVNVGPAARMQVLMTGEDPVPGSVTGKTGEPEVLAVGLPTVVTVRQTDIFWNLVASGDSVELSTFAAFASNLPQQATLLAGSTVFNNVIFLASGTARLTARDLSAPFTLTDVGTLVGIFSHQLASPTVRLAIPSGSLRATIGGEVAGTAADAIAVARVSVAVQRRPDGLWYDWFAAAFSPALPVYGLATVTPNLGRDTSWTIALPDAKLTDGASYYVVARATNPSSNLALAESTFTFSLGTLTPGSGADGSGNLSLAPNAGPGCDVAVSTLVFTAGPSGLAAGGLLSIRLPDGWTKPSSVTVADPPANPGEVRVFPGDALVSLEDGWIHVSTPLAAGRSLEVKVRSFRPSRSIAQPVLALSRGAAGGQLLPLANLPSITLTAGATQALHFNPSLPLTMGPLQPGPTLQLRLTDLCGTDTVAPTTYTVTLAADSQSIFHSTGGIVMPAKQVPIVRGTGSSAFGFYVRPSSAATRLTASATGLMPASLDLRVLSSSLAVTDVSVDTGALSAGNLVSTMTSNPFQRPAFVNFTLPEGVPWQVLITTGQGEPIALARRTGEGSSGRAVTWTGLDERFEPRRAAPPGEYWVRVEAGGGVAVSSTARLYVSASAVPSIYGQLGAAGASARVAASGPGAGPGSFAVASSTGFFQVFGLTHGTTYELRATSGSSVWVATAPADFGGFNAGSLATPTTGQLRLSVGLPLPAPAELWGTALIHDDAYANETRLALRFSSGSSVSDDGAPGFGSTGSTWAVAHLPAGAYTLELNLPEVRLSTRVTGLSVTAGARLDVRLALPAKPRASGRVLLPAAPAEPVTVYLAAGDARSSFVLSAASAAFSLFGLDAGTQTLTASALGYRASSAAIVVTTADVSGLDLGLSTAGAISGLVVVAGDTLGDGATYSLLIEGYHPATSARARTSVVLPRVSTSASVGFTLTGLADGAWELSASLDGFVGGRSSAAAGGTARLDLVRRDGWTVATVRLPGGPHGPSEFRRVGVAHRGDDGLTRLLHDFTAGATVQYEAAAATAPLGGLPPGRVSFAAVYAGTGGYARASRLLTQGATHAVTLDLSGSTYAVRGSIGINGTIVFSSAGYSVAVSSVPGLLAQSATVYQCVLGSTAAVRSPGFHVQLVPLEPGALTAGELRRSTACASAVLADDEPPFAYLAAARADGTFEFPGVSRGAYLLRTTGDVDGDLSNGLEVPPVSTTVFVGADVSGLTLRVDRGRRVGGRVTGAPGRPLGVALLDASGAVARRAVAAPDWVFDGVAPGEYTLVVDDPASPKVYAMRPRPLTVAADVSGLEAAVEAAGTVRGRLVLEVPASSAVAVTAVAAPWFHGGAYAARLDGDRFVVEGLPPGTYEVRAQPLDARFAGGSATSVVVPAGRVIDVGDVSVPLAREVRGLVVAGGATPAAGIPVQAVPSYRVPGGPPAVHTVTGIDGRYVLRGLDPRARLYDVTAAARVEHDAFGAAVRWLPATAVAVDVTSSATVDFALSPALYSIRGRVTPAPARLTLQKTGEVRAISAFTLHDGTFELPSLATGTYRLTASAEGRSSLSRLAAIVNASVDVGTMTLVRGSTLSGRLLKSDGSAPSTDEVRRVEAAAPDVSEVLSATLSADNSEYEVSGLRPGRPYRLLAVGRSGEVTVLGDVTFSTTTESRRLDVVYKAPKPAVLAKARRSGAGFELTFEVTSPLRSRTAADEDLSAILSTFSAAGTLSQRSLHSGRTRLTAFYTPGVSESSFTLRFAGYATALDSDSSDRLNREHLVVSTVAFYTGVQGAHRAEIPNLSGGAVGVDGDAGRVTLPAGAFVVDASSSVEVTLNVAPAIREGALPAGLMRAMAARPPEVSPFSAFYEILLPLGVRTSLAKAAPLSVSYSTAADPSKLNLYWYNPQSNSFVLQQDVTGAPPIIDRVNRTITVNVDHFSTYVLFETDVNVIGGTVFGGGELEAYNFPNPFDLKEKVVTTIHGGGTPVVRGTMIRFSLPPSLSGAGSVRIYDVSGRRIRTIDLGNLTGGSHYYQPWDGRTDAGVDAASGVYIGVLRVGKSTKSFKMALIK